MCIIIERSPGFEIPYEKLKNSVINNPDGYGIAFPEDDGKLRVIRSAEEPDADDLHRLLTEDLKEDRVLLHLRYTTAGATNLRNAHPFPILERDVDGVDLRMAHNGTIGSYRPEAGESSSDTRLFVRDMVRPLFKRMAGIMEPEEILADPLTKSILTGLIPTSSVLYFMDGHGNTMGINETGNGGKREDSWYYSNTYSFNADHRTPTPYSYGSPYGNFPKAGGTTSSTTTSKTTNTSGALMKTSTSGLNKETTRFFSESTGIDQDDLVLLTDDHINKLVNSSPYDAVSLIKELLYLKATSDADLVDKDLTIKGLRSKLQ